MNTIFKWTDDLTTNYKKIDNDHQKIIEKAQELNEAMMNGKGSKVINETMRFLNEYVESHFKAEEALQISNRYPRLTNHKREHEYFIVQLSNLAKKIDEKPDYSPNAIELNKLMVGWFYRHIKEQDADFAAFLADSNQ